MLQSVPICHGLLASVASNPGQYSATCHVVLVISRLNQSRSGPGRVTSLAHAHGHVLCHIPLPLRLDLDKYVLTVDTRPFLFGRGGAWV